MKRPRSHAFACIAILTAVPVFAQPPTNDDCANAISVGLGDFSFDTTGATTDGPPASCSAMQNDVWFRFIGTCEHARPPLPPPATATVYLNTLTIESSAGDFAVYDAADACPGSIEAACNAPASPEFGSHFNRLIRIGTQDGSTVAGTLSIDCSRPAVFLVHPQGADPGQFNGRLTVIASQGDQVCFDLCGRSPPPGLHKYVQLTIVDGSGGASGTVSIDCASATIDTSAPTFPGSPYNTVDLTDCVGGPPNGLGYSLFQFPPGNVSLSASGNYLGEACWVVSDDACGQFAIDYLNSLWCGPQCFGVPFHTFFQIPSQAATSSTSIWVMDLGADVIIESTNDDCVDAANADVGFLIAAATPYDTSCASSDAPAASCSAMQNGVWFTSVASCTGRMEIATGPDADYAVYAAGVGCTPAAGDEIACNDPFAPVEQGQSYLIRIASDDGAEVEGDLALTCRPLCRDGFPPGSAETVADCGYTPCVTAACESGLCTGQPVLYGDANRDGTVDVFDILCVLDAFAGNFTECPFDAVDLYPCEPDGFDSVDIFDILAVLDAFAGADLCCG
ncbi:MAG: hypothetical protein HOP29_16980 [Phycisphaerales bacterium]|nr:hypothetical protein [Phycisphaerales bacterium]